MHSIRFIGSLLVLFLFTAQFTFAQDYTTRKNVTGKLKKMYKKAMDYNNQGKNKDAIREFEKILKKDPTFIDAQIQWAAMHYAEKQFSAAEQGFEKVLQIDSTYNTKVFYTLAMTEMRLKKYLEAANHFKSYQQLETRNQTLLKKADFYYKSSLLIHNAINNPVPFDPISLGTAINSEEHEEYLPSLTADGQTLVFTRNLNGRNEDFYVSRKVDGQWTESQPIKVLNTDLNEGAQSVSADGKFIVFTDCGGRSGYGSCDIFYSEVKNGRWTKAKNLGQPVNTRGYESTPSISANRNELYFISDRSGGEGKTDIWVSYRQADGSWSNPQNLGDQINTPKSESCPFIHPDGQTLYFMSEGHPGMGGVDLFYSRKQADGSWGEPVNLGAPINTSGDEGSLIVSLDGKTAYFATNKGAQLEYDRKNNPQMGLEARGNHDLYQFELYPEARPKSVTYVKAIVTDQLSGDPLEAQFEIIDLNTSKTFVASITDKDGEFLVCLPAGQDYALNVSAEQYLFHSENFALTAEYDFSQPFLLDIKLQPIPTALPDGMAEGEPIILKNVFFATAKADLRPESVTELNRLYQLLVDNAEMRIQVNGHTDNVGSDEDNLQLSEARAKAVYDFLVEKGIDNARLQYKGFGETKPIDTNDTDAGRQRNRRTEFMVVQ